MTELRLKHIKLLQQQSDLDKSYEDKLLINTINAHSYNMARKDELFAEALLNGDVLIPDGASIVKAVKWLRDEKIERIAGWDLFVYEMNLLEQRTKDKRIKNQEPRLEKGKAFFLGSSEVVLTKIKEKAVVDYPHLEIYTYSPPYKPEFTEEENQEMIESVNSIQPDLLWIGMTAPKQEKWAYKHFKELNVKGHIGTIGAVFDFYAGTVERAPLWWQKHSLEWFYRLVKEPKRMWRRYLIGNMKFIGYVVREKFS